MGRRWLALRDHKVRGRDGEEVIGPTRLSLSRLGEGVGRS